MVTYHPSMVINVAKCHSYFHGLGNYSPILQSIASSRLDSMSIDSVHCFKPTRVAKIYRMQPSSWTLFLYYMYIICIGSWIFCNGSTTMWYDMHRMCCAYSSAYSCDLHSKQELQRSSGYILRKCSLHNPGLLMISALWMMLPIIYSCKFVHTRNNGVHATMTEVLWKKS